MAIVLAKNLIKSDPLRKTVIISFIIAIIILLSIIIGVSMLLVPNDRIYCIKEYNRNVELWNSEGMEEMKLLRPHVYMNGTKYEMKNNTSVTGDNYPYRDVCTKKGDPSCLESNVMLYDMTVLANCSLENLSIVYSIDEIRVLNDSIQLKKVLALKKQSIGCEGGTDAACTRVCEKIGGEWIADLKRCRVIAFLHRVCYRLTYSPIHMTWLPDSALSPYPGCEYHTDDDLSEFMNYKFWSPYTYFAAPPSTIRIEVRHVRDPYIAASRITEGCSNNNLHNNECFGHSKDDEIIVGRGLIVGALILVAAELFLFFHMYKLRRDGVMKHIISEIGYAFDESVYSPTALPVTEAYSETVQVDQPPEEEEERVEVYNFSDNGYSTLEESFIGTPEGI